jgi:hypothetical protein
LKDEGRASVLRKTQRKFTPKDRAYFFTAANAANYSQQIEGGNSNEQA